MGVQLMKQSCRAQKRSPVLLQGPPDDKSERTGYQRIYAYDVYVLRP